MKLFGKRGKDQSGDQPQQHDPRSAYALAPLPRHAGPPASSTPLADQLNRGGPGVTDGYVVLPRALAEQMPLPWQQQAVGILAQFHHTHRGLEWPRYRVLPSREERLVDLDEEQLAEAGFVVEMDVNGDLVYRERNGRKIPDPESTSVLVTCLDPVQPRRPTAAQPPPQVQPGAPVPMNIGPQPVWDVVPSKAHREPPPTFTPAGREPAGREPAGREPAGRTPAESQPAPEKARGSAPATSPQPPVSRPAEPAGREPAWQRPAQSPEPTGPEPAVSRPAEPQPAQQQARTTPPAAQPPAQPAEPEQPEPAVAAEDDKTPPSGIPVVQDPLDWFAEPSEFAELPEPDSLDDERGFGPSGEPIERPYRYNR